MRRNLDAIVADAERQLVYLECFVELPPDWLRLRVQADIDRFGVNPDFVQASARQNDGQAELPLQGSRELIEQKWL